MQVRIIESDQFSAIRSSWISLLPEDRWAFFVHPDWCRVVWESYFPNARIRFHVAYEGEHIVGILPTCHRRMNRFGLFLPVTDGFVGGRGDYSVPVTGPRIRPHVVRCLIESALRDAHSSGTLVLANVPIETGVPEILEDILEEQELPYQCTKAPSPVLSLPASFEEFETSLKKKLRADLRRQSKRLEEVLGPLEFRVVTDRKEAEALLPSLFEMHDRRWLESGVPASFADARARTFYYRMVSDLWDQGLHLSILSAGDRVAACHLGMIWSGYLLYFKPTFDPELRNYSPGKLHLRLLLAHAIERGLRGVDFLQGSEGYKSDWTSETTDCRTYLIRARALSLSYPWLTRGRPTAERILGRTYHRVTTTLERWRRG